MEETKERKEKISRPLLPCFFEEDKPLLSLSGPRARRGRAVCKKREQGRGREKSREKNESMKKNKKAKAVAASRPETKQTFSSYRSKRPRPLLLCAQRREPPTRVPKGAQWRRERRRDSFILSQPVDGRERQGPIALEGPGRSRPPPPGPRGGSLPGHVQGVDCGERGERGAPDEGLVPEERDR